MPRSRRVRFASPLVTHMDGRRRPRSPSPHHRSRSPHQRTRPVHVPDVQPILHTRRSMPTMGRPTPKRLQRLTMAVKLLQTHLLEACEFLTDDSRRAISCLPVQTLMDLIAYHEMVSTSFDMGVIRREETLIKRYHPDLVARHPLTLVQREIESNNQWEQYARVAHQKRLKREAEFRLLQFVARTLNIDIQKLRELQPRVRAQREREAFQIRLQTFYTGTSSGINSNPTSPVQRVSVRPKSPHTDPVRMRRAMDMGTTTIDELFPGMEDLQLPGNRSQPRLKRVNTPHIKKSHRRTQRDSSSTDINNQYLSNYTTPFPTTQHQYPQAPQNTYVQPPTMSTTGATHAYPFQQTPNVHAFAQPTNTQMYTTAQQPPGYATHPYGVQPTATYTQPNGVATGYTLTPGISPYASQHSAQASSQHTTQVYQQQPQTYPQQTIGSPYGVGYVPTSTTYPQGQTYANPQGHPSQHTYPTTQTHPSQQPYPVAQGYPRAFVGNTSRMGMNGDSGSEGE